MNLLPRRARDVTPLSPGVESLLRSLPRVEAPADGRVRLFAAYARGERAPAPLVSMVPLWLRFAVPASAAAAVVLAVGLAGAGAHRLGGPGSGGSTIAMVDYGSVPAPSRGAMRVVDDTSIPMAARSSGLPLGLGASGSFGSFGSWSADGLDGP